MLAVILTGLLVLYNLLKNKPFARSQADGLDRS